MAESTDDELGSFLAEINQIEETIPVELDTNEKESQRVKLSELVVSKPQVISKAPEIIVAPEINVSERNPLAFQSLEKTSWNEYSAFENSAAYSLQEPNIFPPKPPLPPTSNPHTSSVPAIKQNKKFVRNAADNVWVDETLNEWPENDFRLFVGDLGNEVTTEALAKEFSGYKTFAKAKIIREGYNMKSKGYGFVSFLDPFEAAKAIREKNGKYLGNRPMKISKSTWKDRDIKEVKKKDKKKRKLQESLGLV